MPQRRMPNRADPPRGRRQSSAREWRSGKIGSCSRCAEITERLDEKNETDAIAEETDDRYAEGDVNGGSFAPTAEPVRC
jgi:hypothetical protein